MGQVHVQQGEEVRGGGGGVGGVGFMGGKRIFFIMFEKLQPYYKSIKHH